MTTNHLRTSQEGLLKLTLAELAIMRRQVEKRIHELVSEARQDGLTWAQIGRQLGVSAQEAHRRYRFAPPVHPPIRRD